MRLHRLLTLLALSAIARSAKVSGPRLWVKRPGTKKLVIIDSLASLCVENELDEEAIMAVSRGEVDDHKGWECGEMECEDGTDETADEDATTEAEAGEEEQANEEADGEADAESSEPAAAAATPPAMSKMVVGMVAPMLAVQLMKRFDETKPEFLLGLRGAYTAAVCVHTVTDLVLQQAIAAKDDKTPVKQEFNPLSMLFGGGGAAGPQTARAYDMAQLAKARNSFRMGVVVVALLHWKFKWTQMLAYQAAQLLVELFYHPLVQIHLLGRPARSKCAPLAVPDVGSCACPGRAWQLWLARRSLGRDRSTGRAATAPGPLLELAASKVAHFPALIPFRPTDRRPA